MIRVTATNNTMTFERDDGKIFKFHHLQDCCEDVHIEDICGELTDLVGSPLTTAEETGTEKGSQSYDSVTWTFYRFATEKGWVTVRWCGSSNGYYSESVDFAQIN
jgi:hypothetical protein